jgi:hypothetical protein
MPITIRASDPTHPPVWDLSATLVENAPGSYTAGDRGRGCWQVDGGTGYVIESLVFTGCRTSTDNSAGIRYYNGASVTIRDVLFKDNDNGITAARTPRAEEIRAVRVRRSSRSRGWPRRRRALCSSSGLPAT